MSQRLGRFLGDHDSVMQITELDEASVRAAIEHRVAAVLAHTVSAREPLSSFGHPTELLLQELRSTAVCELGTRDELRSVVQAFASAGIDLLLLKGAALAYTHYPAPYLRPRCDTDLLVRRVDRRGAHERLLRLSYTERPALTGEHVSQQAQYVRALRAGVDHSIDLHWRVFNPAAFADVLAFDELWPERRPIPALCDGAWSLAPAHALLLALIHRVAHHEPDPDLLWLFDIHLLARALSREEWHTLTSGAESHAIAPLCAEGLQLARTLFATPLPPHVMAWVALHRDRELPARFKLFQQGRRRVVDVFLSDFSAARGWRARMGLVREHLLPPAEYMRRRYGLRSDWWLPIAYVRRIVRGAVRWFRPGLYR